MTWHNYVTVIIVLTTVGVIADTGSGMIPYLPAPQAVSRGVCGCMGRILPVPWVFRRCLRLPASHPRPAGANPHLSCCSLVQQASFCSNDSQFHLILRSLSAEISVHVSSLHFRTQRALEIPEDANERVMKGVDTLRLCRPFIM